MPKPLNWLGKSRAGVVATVIGSIVVLQANAERVGATITNDSINPMYLAKGDAAAVNAGIRLNANGGSYEINLTNPWYGPISIASAAAGDNICWTEDE